MLCLGARQSYRDLTKLRAQQSINFSKLHQIHQDIILTPTLTITPANPNSDFENFRLLVKWGLYYQYFGLLRKYKNIGSTGPVERNFEWGGWSSTFVRDTNNSRFSFSLLCKKVGGGITAHQRPLSARPEV